MKTFDLIAIAFALAMDAFAVSIAIGVILEEVNKRQIFRISWHFGLFQALMPLIGWFLGSTVQHHIEKYDHWIAFGLLAVVGGRMLWGAFFDSDDELNAQEPTKGWSLVILSVATSIDALAIGLSLAMIKVSIYFPALVIGVIAALLSLIGIKLGAFVGKRIALSRYAIFIGGIVLNGIGIKILYEHGVF